MLLPSTSESPAVSQSNANNANPIEPVRVKEKSNVCHQYPEHLSTKHSLI